MSINLSSQCVQAKSVVISTTPSCSNLKNGVLIIKKLYPNTPYDIVFDNTVRSYTTNDLGVLHVYSMAPGTHKLLGIIDRVNNCKEIEINQLVIIQKYSLEIEGIDKVCEGDELKLTTNVPSSWSVNSSRRSSNSSEFNYTVTESKDIIIHAKGIVNSCYERDTFHVTVAKSPNVRMLNSNGAFCYNKQNQIINLEITNGTATNALFNNNKVDITEENKLILNTGDETDENILRITSTNDLSCAKEDVIELQFSGEAPTSDIEILWWPGNIFSVKNEVDDLNYSWGWLNKLGKIEYVNGHFISSDGKFYFAGRSNILVNEIIEKGEEAEQTLFVEYKYKDESCFNRLSFNSAENYEFRSQVSNPKLNVIAYPNPFIESLTISTADFREYNALNLSIIGSDAKIYYNNKIQSLLDRPLTLSTQDFPKGTYFIYLNSGEYTLTSKVIIKQ